MLKFENKTLEVIGDIGESWFSEGITAQSVAGQLNGCTEPVDMVIGSLGGSVSDALAIHGMLGLHPHGLTGKIIGMTASSGTVIGMAVPKPHLGMADSALFLIHNASTGTYGNADTMQKTAEDLRVIDNQLARIYSNRTGKPETEMLALMKQERWLNATEALEYGFIDYVFKGTDAVNTKAVNSIKAATLLPLFKTKEEIVNQIVKPKISNTMSEEEIAAMQAELEQLKTDKAALEAELAMYKEKEAADQAAAMEKETEEIAEEGVKNKKYPATAKAQFLALAKVDPAGTRAAIAAMPPMGGSLRDLLNGDKPAATELVAMYKEKQRANKLGEWAAKNPEQYNAAVEAVKLERKNKK